MALEDFEELPEVPHGEPRSFRPEFVFASNPESQILEERHTPTSASTEERNRLLLSLKLSDQALSKRRLRSVVRKRLPTSDTSKLPESLETYQPTLIDSELGRLVGNSLRKLVRSKLPTTPTENSKLLESLQTYYSTLTDSELGKLVVSSLTFSLYPNLLLYDRGGEITRLEWAEGTYKSSHTKCPTSYAMHLVRHIQGSDLFLGKSNNLLTLRNSEGIIVHHSEIPSEPLQEAHLLFHPEGTVHLVLNRGDVRQDSPCNGEFCPKEEGQLVELYEVDTKRRVITFLRNLSLTAYLVIPQLGYLTWDWEGEIMVVTLWEWIGSDYKPRRVIPPPWDIREGVIDEFSPLMTDEKETKLWKVGTGEVVSLSKEHRIVSPNLLLVEGSYSFSVWRRQEGDLGKVREIYGKLKTFAGRLRGFWRVDEKCLVVRTTRTLEVLMRRKEGLQVVWELPDLRTLLTYRVLPPGQKQVEERVRKLGELVELPRSLVELVVGFC